MKIGTLAVLAATLTALLVPGSRQAVVNPLEAALTPVAATGSGSSVGMVVPDALGGDSPFCWGCPRKR
jgi:hypothetical protein